MKPIFAPLLGILLSLGCYAYAQTAPPLLKDTLTIEIGKDKKVIILVKDKQALKSLEQYDLNKMVRDLNDKADSLQQKQTILITDEAGNRYRIAVEIEETPADTAETNGDSRDFHITFGSKGKGDDNDKDKPKEHHYSRTRGSFLFDLGMNNYLQNGSFPQDDDAQHAVKSWGSWYLGINKAYTTQIAGPLALQWGAGINWYNFKFEDPKTRLRKTDGEIDFYKEPDSEVYAEKSKLTVSYINIQAVPMLDFGYRRKTITNDDGTTSVNRWHDDKSFRIGLGGYAGYRLGSYTKYKFEIDNDEKKDRDRDSYYLNNWRYGVRMQLGYKGLDLFAQYDLNGLFSNNRGPELNAISFGIMF